MYKYIVIYAWWYSFSRKCFPRASFHIQNTWINITIKSLMSPHLFRPSIVVALWFSFFGEILPWIRPPFSHHWFGPLSRRFPLKQRYMAPAVGAVPMPACKHNCSSYQFKFYGYTLYIRAQKHPIMYTIYTYSISNQNTCL